ncbi:MAG: phage holin family protein [Anaerolineae bacterium]|jgi:predicted phage tail protein|nr:phage holin family protein [Gloeobacterales cyanobacterium ES-bin-313]
MEKSQESSLKVLIKDLVLQFEVLFTQHVQLVRQEMVVDGRKLAVQAGGLVLGLLLVVLGLAFVGVALLVSLQLVLPTWAAAILVAVLFLVGGGLITVGSIRNLTQRPKGRALEEAQETLSWLMRKK